MLRQISELRAERAFQTARFYERTKCPKSAKFYYQQVVDQYPGSPWAAQAQAALGGRPITRTPKPQAAPAPRPEPTPPPTPTTEPAPKPVPKPKPRPKPSTRPATAPKPVDLEKLAQPSRKGGKK